MPVVVVVVSQSIVPLSPGIILYHEKLRRAAIDRRSSYRQSPAQGGYVREGHLHDLTNQKCERKILESHSQSRLDMPWTREYAEISHNQVFEVCK